MVASLQYKCKMLYSRYIYMLTILAALAISANPSNGSPTVPNIFSARRGINIPKPFARMSYDGPFKSRSQVSRFHGIRRYLSAEMVRRLSEVGIELVRLPVNPAVLLENSGQARKDLIEEVAATVDEFVQNGIAVVVDLHFWSPDDPVWTQKAIFGNANSPHFRAFRKVLSDVALALAQRRHGTVALELLNEPLLACRLKGPDNWAILQLALISDVRAVSADLPIVATGCGNEPSKLMDLRNFPVNDVNIIYTFHYYSPFIFTHQGTQYFPLIQHLVYPTSYGTLDDALNNIQSSAKQSEASLWQRLKAENEVRRYFAEKFGIAAIKSEFRQISGWARQAGIRHDQIFLGEFAPLDLPPNNTEADYDSRLRWIEDVRKVADEFRFAYAYWLFEDHRGALIDRKTLRLRPRLGTALGLVSDR